VSLTGLLFVVAFLWGAVAAFVRHPVYGLVTYIGVFYLHPPSRWWGQGLLHDVRWSLLAAAIAVVAVTVNPPKQSTAPILRSGPFWAFVAFIAWIALQGLWAKDAEAHADLLTIYLKFLVVMYLFCRCIDSEQALAKVFWAHVLGCFYLGWLAYTSYGGGRFEDFGGPGIGEANAAALQMVTGAVVAGSLFLASDGRVRIALLVIIPIIVNAVVTTISRSGFLAAGVAGLVYNLFTPARYRARVGVLSVLALVLFALLTNPIYWTRIGSLKYRGEEVEGVDTGGGRLVIIEAQWKMFRLHPLGCGHMCTTVLSPGFLEESRLTDGARSSHNTFMTMLVDHGIPGGVFYLGMLAWIVSIVRATSKQVRGLTGMLPLALPAIAAALGAITIGDLFVQYPKFEARVWFISLLPVLTHLVVRARQPGPVAEK
jgi:O-antigen ligase